MSKKYAKYDVVLAYVPIADDGEKQRPVVVVQNENVVDAVYDLIMIAPITHTIIASNMRILIKKDSSNYRFMGLKGEDSNIVINNIVPISKRKIIKKIGKCPMTGEIHERIKNLFDV